MGNINLYKVEKGRSEEEFLRDSFIDIASNYHVPAEFYDCDFSDVKMEYRKFLILEMDIDIRYTAMLGFYKWGKESRGKSYLESYKWKPYNNTLTGKKTSIVLKNDSIVDKKGVDNVYNLNVAAWVSDKEKSRLSVDEQEKWEMPSKQKIDGFIHEKVEECMDIERKQIPGDTYRDLTYDYECSYKISGYTIPQYSTTCVMEGKECSIQDFAPGGFRIDFVPNIKDSKFSKGVIQNNKKISLPFIISLALLFALSSVGIAFFVGFVTSRQKPTLVALIVLIVLSVGLLVSSVTYYRIFMKRFNEFQTNNIVDSQNLKIEKLQSCLKRYNLKELSEIEKDKIVNCEFPSNNKGIGWIKTLYCLIGALTGIALLFEILLLTSF